MTLRSTKRQASASRTHRTPLFLPCSSWPRGRRTPDRSAPPRTQPWLASGEGRMPPPLSPTRRERTCGGRDAHHPRPAEPLAASPPRSRIRGRGGCAGRSEHDRARATRDLPGRAGRPAAGVRAAGLAPGPGRTGGGWQPPPRPLAAAPHGGGAAPGAGPSRQGGGMPPARLCCARPAPRPAPRSAPARAL